jgi:hypothetical protein
MACEVKELDGHTIIFCSKGRKLECYYCGAYAGFLCDYVINAVLNNSTCDRLLCDEHRVIQSEGIDYCPEHAALKES